MFLRASMAGTATVLTAGGYTWLVEPYWIEVVRRRLPIRNLPAALEGRTMVQLSDIHVGKRVDDEYVLSVFERVRQLTPDIVVYTGDFISYHRDVFDQMAAVYDYAPHGRIATLASFGNHDYGARWEHPEVAAQLQRLLARRGIDVLRNAARDVAGLTIVGLDDLWARRFDPGVLSMRGDERASVVLSHNPDTVDLPGWERFRGWILAGHTHGGQCKPPFLPPPLLPVRNTRYSAGEFAIEGERTLYVNRGVGFLIQVRFNARPEITHFTLTVAS